MTRVLIVRLGALGDIVHAMPVATALRRAYPDATIDWLVDPRYLDVVRLVPAVTAAIPFDPRGLVAGDRRADTMATIADLRRANYDAVIDLQGLVKSASVARLAGGARTIGFAKEQLREPAARFFYSETVTAPEGAHVIVKNLAMLSAFGVSPAPPTFELTLPEVPQVTAAAAAVGEAGYAVVNPGAAWPNKRWPAERFGALAARIRQEHGFPALVAWGPGEESLADDVVAASDGAARLAPQTSVPELFQLMRRARIAIAGDTGPLHIAAAVGTPVVALFGPTWSARNGPWHPDDISVSRAESCECHYQRQCRRASPCIDEIAVDDVAAAVTTRLQRAYEGRPS